MVSYLPNISQTSSYASMQDEFRLCNRQVSCYTVVQEKSHDLLSIECKSGSMPVMWLAYNKGQKIINTHINNAELLYSALLDCLNKKQTKMNREIGNVCNVLNKAFVNLPLRNVAVDYGVGSKALVYDVLLNSGLRFVSRVCVDDEEGIVTFAIYNMRELLYMNSDLLDSYPKHVTEFWEKMNVNVETPKTTYGISKGNFATKKLY